MGPESVFFPLQLCLFLNKQPACMAYKLYLRANSAHFILYFCLSRRWQRTCQEGASIKEPLLALHTANFASVCSFGFPLLLKNSSFQHLSKHLKVRFQSSQRGRQCYSGRKPSTLFEPDMHLGPNAKGCKVTGKDCKFSVKRETALKKHTVAYRCQRRCQKSPNTF